MQIESCCAGMDALRVPFSKALTKLFPVKRERYYRFSPSNRHPTGLGDGLSPLSVGPIVSTQEDRICRIPAVPGAAATVPTAGGARISSTCCFCLTSDDIPGSATIACTGLPIAAEENGNSIAWRAAFQLYFLTFRSRPRLRSRRGLSGIGRAHSAFSSF